MSIEQANQVIMRAESGGLVMSEGDMVSPLFNPGVVDLPLGYRPSSEIFADEDPVDIMIGRVAERTSCSPTEIAATLNQVIREEFDGLLWPEAAIVLIAKRHGVACDDLITRLREHAIKKD